MLQAPSHVVSFEEALLLVLAQTAGQTAGLPAPPQETVPLLAARTRVLAEPVHADRDQPAFNRVTRDGFAVRAAELSAGWLPVAGEIRAGGLFTGEMAPGTALAIMTGAPLPAGADAVVMVEHVETARTGETTRIRLSTGRSLKAGENVVPRGSEALRGQVVITPGTRIGPAEQALAASCGCAELSVYRRPRVAIMATGDELVPVTATPADHQIRNSNTYAMAGLVEEAGGEPILLPITPDDRTALHAALAEARSADLILLSGGVSMGEYDLVEEVLMDLGATFQFTGVRMQPGKPAVFGQIPALSDKPAVPFFGLPGNPVSTQVTFTCFAAPFLQALSGTAQSGLGPCFAEARLAETVPARAGLTRVLPARLHSSVHGALVKLVLWQGSGDMAAHARANCYAVLPDTHGEAFAEGETIRIILR